MVHWPGRVKRRRAILARNPPRDSSVRLIGMMRWGVRRTVSRPLLYIILIAFLFLRKRERRGRAFGMVGAVFMGWSRFASGYSFGARDGGMCFSPWPRSWAWPGAWGAALSVDIVV